VVTHWAPGGSTRNAPLHRFLFGSRDAAGEIPDTVAVAEKDHVARARLDELAASAGGTISVETALPERPAAWRPPSPSYPSLAVRGFDRTLDTAWVRTSYSGLTAGLHDLPAVHGVGSEAEQPGTVDEPELVTAGVASTATGDPASPMADLPKGATFGTLVHEVLENTDFTDPDLRSHLVEQCEAAGSERFAGVPAAALADALLPALTTPLGPLAGDRRLADVSRADRLDELDFELPLLGGERPTGDARVGEIADLLAGHLPDTDPLRGFADDLRAPVLADRRLRGFLGGSIDLVLRVHADAGPRHLVVDYKTNWLGGEVLTSADYRPDAMAQAMREAHYPLQAMLYSVALHRFLRWRQPGYDPALHLGGVLYLFLRGMCGPATPVVDGVPCGVFSWSPPAALVTDLSDLLDRGTT
jgi:exodeoxyribonuclease V beta subunit